MRRKAVAAAVFIWLLLLAGCAFFAGDELLALPKPPGKYVKLDSKLQKILETGAYFAPPESGSNRQALQLVDIDGDGVDEAVSFFRNSPGSGQFTVYLHKLIGEEYVEMGTISGNGTAIYSVDYPKIQAQGARCILVCWRLEGQNTKGMTVGKFEKGRLSGQLDTEYLSYAYSDLDGDGAEEIVLVVPDGKTGKNIARAYHFRDGAIRLLSEAPLSSGTKNVGKPKIGRMDASRTGVFVESSVEPRGMLTDVLYLAGNVLKNVTIAPETGRTTSTYRPAAIPSADVNGDGIMEIPRAVLLPGYTDPAARDARYRLEWNTVSPQGELETVLHTYHNYAEEWFLILPDVWVDRVTASASTFFSINNTAFEFISDDGKRLPILEIYNFSGTGRDEGISEGDTMLITTTTTTHAARLHEAKGLPYGFGMSEETLKNSFKLIPKDWFSEEYLP